MLHVVAGTHYTTQPVCGHMRRFANHRTARLEIGRASHFPFFDEISFFKNEFIRVHKPDALHFPSFCVNDVTKNLQGWFHSFSSTVPYSILRQESYWSENEKSWNAYLFVGYRVVADYANDVMATNQRSHLQPRTKLETRLRRGEGSGKDCRGKECELLKYILVENLMG